MKKIKITTPGKLMLFGEHAVVYGYPCIVTTVNRYLTIGVEEKRDINDEIITSELSGKGYIREIISFFRKKYQQPGKLKVNIVSQLTGLGLGSSAALTVGLVKALDEFWGIKLADRDIFDICLSIVRKRFPLASGFDLAGCLYGGTIYYDNRTKKVKQLQTGVLPVIAVFTGNKARTEDYVDKVRQLREKKPRFVNNLFDDIGSIVLESKTAMEKGDWAGLGTLMNRNQEDLVKLGVSTEKINMIIEKSQEMGAYGAKLSGAGGGDCLLVLTSRETKNRISEVICRCGGEILDLEFGVEGAETC